MTYNSKKIFVVEHPNPDGSEHFVIVPKIHISSLDELKKNQLDYILEVFSAVNWLLEEKGLKNKEHKLKITTDDRQKHEQIYFHLIAE